MARKWIAQLEGLREPLSDRMAAIAAECRRAREAWTGEYLPEETLPYAEREEDERARQLQISGYATLTVELLLAVYASVTLLVFFWLVAAGIGVVISIALALQVKGVLSASFDPELPRGSVRSLTRWVQVSFLVSLVGIGILLLARSNLWATPLADLVLAILSLSLPVLAGAFFILAHTYGRFGRLERQYDRFRAQVIELDQLLRELRSHIRKERAE